MRCVAYCTAEKYQLKKFSQYFKGKAYQFKFHRDVLHVHHKATEIDIFFFSIGCFVIWNATSQQERTLLKEIQSLVNKPASYIEIDHFSYRYGDTTDIYSHDRFNVDLIVLEDEDIQIKLAISYGLAQSVKLNAYEDSVQETIKVNEDLPRELAKRGRISISGKDISKRMGEIFLERSSVNLSSEYLDMPEYFWQYPRLEDYYIMTEKFLDISSRVDSLNQRLDVLHELFNMLTGQLQHRHSSLLELIIIILILIEVVMSLTQFHL